MQAKVDKNELFLQSTGKFKVRLGFTRQDMAEQWFSNARFDLDSGGILVKNERTNRIVTDSVDNADGDSDSTVSTKSFASSRGSVKVADQDAIVFYDVLPWIDEARLKEIFRSSQNPCRLPSFLT